MRNRARTVSHFLSLLFYYYYLSGGVESTAQTASPLWYPGFYSEFSHLIRGEYPWNKGVVMKLPLYYNHCCEYPVVVEIDTIIRMVQLLWRYYHKDGAPYCGHCIVPLRLNHILVECLVEWSTKERKRHFGQLRQEVTIKDILTITQDNVVNINNLISFLREIGIYDKI